MNVAHGLLDYFVKISRLYCTGACNNTQPQLPEYTPLHGSIPHRWLSINLLYAQTTCMPSLICTFTQQLNDTSMLVACVSNPTPLHHV